jgi:flagellin-like protein
MHRARRWRNYRRQGIAEIIGVILLVALTVTAGIILWSFRINPPPAPPTVSFTIRSGGSNPVWGDPTDCQPWGYNMSSYPSGGLSSAQARVWVGNPNDGPTVNTWYGQCGDGNDGAVTGNYSTLNTSQIIVSGHSPSYIPLDKIDLTFVCNNATSSGGTTILINGSLASMLWFPGSTSQPAANAPYLGYCGNFNAGGYGGAAFSTLYNRLGLFVPLQQGITGLENGDTFILYIHNGGWPIDFECVAMAGGINFADYTPQNGCQHLDHGNPIGVPQLDYDDYHGAPPWCFASLGACTIYLTYTGSPGALLATIPVYSLAPPTAT